MSNEVKIYKDVNGQEIHMGDVVRISGCYFKTKNGVYFVEYEPGYANWPGLDLALIGLNERSGKKVAKSNPRHIEIYPIGNYVSSRRKQMEADAWDKKNVVIEKLSDSTSLKYRKTIREWFSEEIDRLEASLIRSRELCLERDVRRLQISLAQLRDVIGRLLETA